MDEIRWPHLISMSKFFCGCFVFSLRFMFAMNVLQPKFSVNTRTWDVKKWYELFIHSKIFLKRASMNTLTRV